MAAPSVPLHVWLLGAFDPVLIAVAIWLGWRATQFGKVFIAAIAALAVSVVTSWLIHNTGLPWIAPIGADAPTLLPIRTVAAVIWASAGYAARRLSGR
ncbi:hypothetical protein [Microvirga flavescens]|uniref:hypothetical protein n=1 Tax=Microvirga flavescens TaxID=2249811 RepID=UPI000DD68FD9|nr:hypothetical protein [Microvirga flavescens]